MKPQITRIVNGFLFVFEDISIKVSRCHVHNDGRVTGELSISTVAEGYNPILHPSSQFNFSSDTTRRNLVKGLKEKFPSWDWLTIIETLVYHVQELARQGQPVEELWSSADAHRPEFLLEPILYKNLPTLLFGEKAVCKSWLALVIYICLILPWYDNPLGWTAPKRSIKTLYADYEVDAEVAHYNIQELQKGMNLPPIPLYYRRCEAPLPDDMEQLGNHISNIGAEVIIIDSLGPAVGGNLKDPEEALRFTASLRQLKCAALIIGQTSKDKEAKVKSVFGSTFFEYYARNIFELRKVQEEDEDSLNIALFNTYHNLGRKIKPMGFHLTFNGAGTHIETAPITARELVARIGTQAEILHLLKETGAMKPTDIAGELNIKPNTAIQTIRRMLKKEQLVKLSDGTVGVCERFV